MKKTAKAKPAKKKVVKKPAAKKLNTKDVQALISFSHMIEFACKELVKLERNHEKVNEMYEQFRKFQTEVALRDMQMDNIGFAISQLEPKIQALLDHQSITLKEKTNDNTN